MLRYRRAAPHRGLREEALYVGTTFDLAKSDSMVWDRNAGPHYIPVRDISVVPDANLQIATGLALAGKLQAQKTTVMMFTRVVSAEHDKKTLRFAVLNQLPIVYVLRGTTAIKSARPPKISVDGSDAVALYRVAQEAIYRTRIGGGPTLIECRQSATDPLLYMREYLENKNIWRPELERED
ncbi:MAG: thiamine pyrophosphate-dependent enzyme [Acidobacteriaceae bacterium]